VLVFVFVLEFEFEFDLLSELEWPRPRFFAGWALWNFLRLWRDMHPPGVTGNVLHPLQHEACGEITLLKLVVT
jgi:hypothetical protein